MDITIIVGTYNRCRTLTKALESVAASELPDSVSWEVLVVDNNSTDETRSVVQDYCNRYSGRFRYLFEPTSGKSFALNAGIRQSLGDTLVFLDDDVEVEPSWLRNLTSNLDRGKWAGAGGRTIPAHIFSRPRWLPLDGPYNMSGILALFDFGDTERTLDKPPYGANMAYQKRMFEKYGLFRTDLGPSPNLDVPRPNEDTEFGRRLLAGGEHLRYTPSAVVRHPVPESRLNKKYFLSWWFDYGRAVIRERGKKPQIFYIPRHYFSIPKMIATYLSLRGLQWICTLDSQKRFYRKTVVWMIAGEIVETYRQSRAVAPPDLHAFQRKNGRFETGV